MYNDELDMALESAFKDGYYQALADMGYEFDDSYEDAEEDVGIFDEGYFDGSEGAARDYRHAQNAGKTPNQIREKREHDFYTASNGGYVIGMKHYNPRLAADMKSGRHLTPNQKAARDRYVAAAKRYDRGRGTPISNHSRIDENADRRLIEDRIRDKRERAARSGRIYE